MSPMENLRTYGAQPYDLVLLHGGPGASGTFQSVARRLSISFGILEPVIISLSINEQLEELNSIIVKNSSMPLFFIGHSWGAWLSLIYAAKFPDMVKKIVVIGAPPFEERYEHSVNETRRSRLNEKEKIEFCREERKLSDISSEANSLSPDFVSLLTRTDVFEALPNEAIVSDFSPAVYLNIWSEASELRKSGKLLEYVKEVKCPVVAIHGDYDPHPAEGIIEPLSANLSNFRFNLIERCGHYPWMEKYGKDILYKLLYKEMGSSCV
jgi:pimeloyl-ACP methyl ester carboxylesterase